MGQLRNKRIVQSRLWLDPKASPIPDYDYEYTYPITVFEAVRRNMDDNSSTLQEELDAIYRMLNGKQNIIDSGIPGNVMAWTGVKGQIGSIELVKAINPEPSARSYQKVTSERAVGDALDTKVSNASFNNHINDTSIHITDVERVRWNAMAPLSTLQNHITNIEMHITDFERARWNAKADQKDFEEHIYDSENPHNTTAHQVGTYSRKEIDAMFENIRSSFFNYLNITWDERNITAKLSIYNAANWNPNYVLSFEEILPNVDDNGMTYFALKPATDYKVNETQDCIIYVKRPGLSWTECGFQVMNPGDMVIKYPETVMYIWVQGRFVKLFSGNVTDKLPTGGDEATNGKMWRPKMTPEGILTWTLSKETEPPDPMIIKGTDGYTPQKGIDYVDGKDGKGVPPAGRPGEVLVKVSDDNYDTKWVNILDSLEDIVKGGGSLPTGAVKWDTILGRPGWYDELGENADGFITQRVVTDELRKLKTEITKILDRVDGPSGLDSINEGIFDHVNDFNNPHRVTPSIIGAVSNATFTDHAQNFSNPHQVTAKQVGLGNVNNTSDLDKPISNATQQALDNLTDRVVTVVNELARANYINNVVYDNTHAVLTFVYKNGTELDVSIPIQEIFKTLFYDDDNHELVLVLPNGSEHRVDVAGMLRYYFGSVSDNIRVVIENDNIIKATIIPGTIGEYEIAPSVNLRNSPTTTTQPVSDRSRRIATTAFVANQVVDNLMSYETDRPLSANQGRILNQKKADIDDVIAVINDLAGFEVIDSLESNNMYIGLSANMGRELNLTKAPLVHTSMTGSEFGRATVNLFGHARAGDTMPLMDGTPYVGTDDGYYSRSDHRHGTDTSRAPMHWPDVGHNQYAFTGEPRSTTPPDDSNDDRIVTTEWVRRNAVGVCKGDCPTAKTDPEKIVKLRSTYCDPVVFIRQIGSTVSVLFQNEDRSGATPTAMNVEDTGMAIILFGGKPMTNGMLGAQHEHMFVWDGEYWRLINPVPGTGMGEIIIGPGPVPPGLDEEPVDVNMISGHNGYTLKADGTQDEDGQVYRVQFNINYYPRQGDVKVTFSDIEGAWAAKMGDGTYIIINHPTVISTTKGNCVVQFTLEEPYPSNSPCQLVYRTTQAQFKIEEI